MKKLLLLIIVLSCSSSRSERLIEQSVEVHAEALNIGLEIGDKITQLKNQAEHLNEPLRSAIQDSVRVLMSDWETWESTIVDVPGYEHNHQEHSHNHGAPPDLTPNMLLDIQQDLKKRALRLSTRARKILDILTKEENEPTTDLNTFLQFQDVLAHFHSEITDFYFSRLFWDRLIASEDHEQLPAFEMPIAEDRWATVWVGLGKIGMAAMVVFVFGFVKIKGGTTP